MLVWNGTIQNGILDRAFQTSDFTARLQIEYLHDFGSVYGRLEVPDTVFFFQIFQLLSHQLEIIQEALLAGFVFGSNVCFAKHHQVVDVITGFEEQAAYG